MRGVGAGYCNSRGIVERDQYVEGSALPPKAIWLLLSWGTTVTGTICVYQMCCWLE